MRRMTMTLLAALAAAMPGAADAADYTIMIYETPQQIALRTAPGKPGADYWAAFAAYGKAMTGAHVLRGGAALTVPPAPEGPSGYFVIDVPDAATADAWAARAPSVAHGGRAVARAHLPMMGGAPK